MNQQATLVPSVVTKQVDMEFVKATKHTFVYEAIREPNAKRPVCTSVYLTKEELGDGSPPPALTLSVSFKV